MDRMHHGHILPILLGLEGSPHAAQLRTTLALLRDRLKLADFNVGETVHPDASKSVDTHASNSVMS
jgi:hypothetical protein